MKTLPVFAELPCLRALIAGIGIFLCPFSPTPDARGASATSPSLDVPAGDWRSLADFGKSADDRDRFLERGPKEFTKIEEGNFIFKPVNNSPYTLIYGPRGKPENVREKIVMMEFGLPDEGCSIGLHFKGGPTEEEPSYLVLVKRAGPDTGAVVVYRCDIWPSDTLHPEQIVGSAKSIPHFLPDEQHSLAVSTRRQPGSKYTSISVTIKTLGESDSLLMTDIFDQEPPLSETGTVAVRFFCGPNKQVLLKSLSARFPK